ncbi:MAG: hypothetical protein HS128_19265 [Ideonella sp.]|nr:hypothetical protein [Ideonella sp.]MCC7455969.1 hypothetical protein [Nitrospira sp.]
MATKLIDSQSTGSTGVKAPAMLTKWPEGGASAQVALSGGAGGGAAVVRLRVGNIVGTKEDIATFTLPVPAGEPNAGSLHDIAVIPATFDEWDWVVDSLTGGGALALALVGLGV